LEKLFDKGVSNDRASELWGDPDPEFFLRHSPLQIVNITQAMDRHDLDAGPLVMIQDLAGRMADVGASEVYVYTMDKPSLFAASALVIDELGLSIHDARVQTTTEGLSLNSYIVLDAEGYKA
jgi:[protein-PII] uridylyltransferase